MARLRKKHDNIGRYNIVKVLLELNDNEINNEELSRIKFDSTYKKEFGIQYHGSSRVAFRGFITFELKGTTDNGDVDTYCTIYFKINSGNFSKIDYEICISATGNGSSSYSTNGQCDYSCDATDYPKEEMYYYLSLYYENSASNIFNKILKETSYTSFYISNIKMYLLNTGVPFQNTL